MSYSTATLAAELGLLEEALAAGGDRPAGSADWRLHQSVRGALQSAVTEVHEVLQDRLAGCPGVRDKSELWWLIGRAAEEGLISGFDVDAFLEALRIRNVVAHVFPPHAIDSMVAVVQRFVPAAWSSHPHLKVHG